MSALQVAALVAAIAAGAAASTVQAVRAGRPSVARVRSILYGGVPASGTAGRPGGQLLDGLVSRVERRLGVGLRLAGLSARAVTTRIVVAFVGGVFLVLLTSAALVSLGTLPVTPLWLVAALLVGVAAAWIMWTDARDRIARRRRELQRAVNEFVQLVAVGLTTDQSVEEAIRFALAVGESPSFDLLRAEIETAPLRGVSDWDALDHLGRRYEIRELSELGASIERQGLQGVAITDTVNSIAASMRAKALDELEREADKVNTNLAGPTVAFVFTVVVFLAYPLAVRISEAFGG
jgi:Flp pilus assembly protein TadB